ncbi:TPA: hypothetical protein ACH3X3_013750 [Trebouxia sp. C0006]
MGASTVVSSQENQYQIPASTRLNFKQKKATKICEELQEADQGGVTPCKSLPKSQMLLSCLSFGRGL